MKKGHESFHLLLSTENRLGLEAISRANGTSMSTLINKAVSEYVVHESKLRTLITGVARMRTQQGQTERLILALFQTQELFIEKFFALAPIYSTDELRQRVQAGKRNFESFVEEALRKNRASGMPILLERMDAELIEMST